MFVEISCQVDVNVFNKEGEKVSRYQQLAREVAICYNQPVDIVPIVFLVVVVIVVVVVVVVAVVVVVVVAKLCSQVKGTVLCLRSRLSTYKHYIFHNGCAMTVSNVITPLGIYYGVFLPGFFWRSHGASL